ncbi:MAG: hypothetical protein K2K48_04625 [Anaeroplasmataceae bacterium]|nr:hypothetical protein [Anaeroplasmataceae bacterium]MDE6414678.1 hypothetical protein [Anaeroplasmataceae bacterium]
MLSFQERYRACKDAVRELSSQTPNKIWIALASILLSILIMVGPIVVLVNCFIFNDLMNLVLIGIILCVYCIILLSRIFYYKTITKKQVEDMHIFYLVDAGVCAIVLCVGIFIGLFI